MEGDGFPGRTQRDKGWDSSERKAGSYIKGNVIFEFCCIIILPRQSLAKEVHIIIFYHIDSRPM